MGGTALTNGSGEAVELAEPTTKIIRSGPPQGEIGSAAAYDRIFSRYEDGKVFSVREVREQDFEEMMRLDGKARTLEQVLTLPLRSGEWSIEPGEGDSGQAEWVREALTRPANAGGMTTPLELVIGQMTSAVVYRRAYFEKVFGLRDGRIVYDKLAWRPQSSCWLLRDSDTYAFRGIKQRFRRGNDTVEKVIPPEKAFVYLHGQHRDPLNGISDLDTAFQIFESKQKIRFLWYSFLENQTIPKGVASHSNSDENEQQALAEKVASLKGGGVIAIGPDQSVDSFESDGSGASTFRDAMSYLDAEMAGSVLAGFTNLTDSDRTGSYALSKDGSNFFLRAEQAKLDEMAAALTSWVIADLIRWNYGFGASVPVLKFKPLAKEATDEALEMLKHLSTQRVLNPAIPAEFIELLVEKVADLLGIDRAKVADAIGKRAEAQANPVAKLNAGLDAAAQLVQSAGVAAAA